MKLNDLLFLLRDDADVCIRYEDNYIKYGEARFMKPDYEYDDKTEVKEIIPNDFTDRDGISYLTIYVKGKIDETKI